MSLIRDASNDGDFTPKITTKLINYVGAVNIHISYYTAKIAHIVRVIILSYKINAVYLFSHTIDLIHKVHIR